MPVSQNLRFLGYTPIEEEPPGESIAIGLRESLSLRGWRPSEIDDWRDGGFIFTCCRGASTLDTILVKTGKPLEWYLQIGPTYVPGLLGYLIGKKASATPGEILDLAKDVHRFLVTQPTFGEFNWCWDGDPMGSEETTPEPQEPES